MNWIELAPSLMSAVASVFAEIAAFLSLRTNKQSIDLAKRSTLAAHHESATIMYSKGKRHAKHTCHLTSKLTFHGNRAVRVSSSLSLLNTLRT